MKTTRKDFERFKAEFIRWQKRLGLTDWCIYSQHEQLEKGTAATLEPDLEARFATACLGFLVKRSVEIHARHEALELLLSELDTLARYRFVRPDEITSARHAVIRRIEALLDELEGTL